MTIWAPELTSRSGPRYLAIADALAADVGCGRLRPGERLPTHRDLADQLHLTVGTITRAYAEAERRGLVSGEVGRGTFVRAPGTDALKPYPGDSATGVVDLSFNTPPSLDEGRALASTLGALAARRDLTPLLRYPPDGGYPSHREAGAQWLSRLGLDADPAHVVVASGSQHAMTAVLAGLLRPGDTLAVEALTYPGLKALAALLHLRLLPLPVDAHGLRVDAFETACRAGGVKAVYVVPTIHNPTTATLPVERREALARIASAHGVLVVEDDVHGRLPIDPLPPIVSFARDVGCYLTGTAKNVEPGLRIGFVLAPPSLVDRVATGIRATTWMAPPLMAEIASTWIRDGTAETIIARKQEEARARHRIALDALRGAEIQSDPQAYHLWLHLPEPWRSDSFVAAALARGVALTPASTFVIGRAATPHAVRVCLGAARDRAQLEGALRTVRELLDSAPASAPMMM